MNKSIDIKLTLRDIVVTRKRLESLMSSLEIKDVGPIFDNNPIFWDGTPKNTIDIPEQFDTDRFIHLLDMLSKTHTHLIRAQELMLRLGTHHVRTEVRLETGKGLPQEVESGNTSPPCNPT
jgi:hypothetical protein